MKIICVGRNYAAHSKELNNAVPTEPIIFMKPDTALLRGKQVFYLPDFSTNIQHELEVVVKISKEGKHIEERFAHKYYEEISIGIDFTARDLQQKLKDKGLPWELAKAFDHSCPVGEFISKSSLPENGIRFQLLKNKVVVQSGNTKEMMFSFDQVISFVSRYITLRKGDLIFTGTPEGVAAVQKGDVLEGFMEEKKYFEVKIG
jgi:acylpyruvate hydrolase